MDALPEALGVSPAFLTLQERLARLAPVPRPVLLVGERGTGKELAAARLHYLSKRWEGPFIRLNCAALAPELLDSELFGHEPGAFTGATRRRLGRFELADGGTLFLDELGQMPVPVQEKLLRVVEYGLFERVGGEESMAVDVRLVAATNADLPALCRAGRFREDLLDRLAFDVTRLPPLRQRREDIPILARHYAARMAAECELSPVPAITARALRALEAYCWPGNIRELRNVVERAVVHHDSGQISRFDFDPFGDGPSSDEAVNGKPSNWLEALKTIPLPMDYSQWLEASRASLVERALMVANHHQRRAAGLLGLSYDQFRTLYRKRSETTPKLDS